MKSNSVRFRQRLGRHSARAFERDLVYFRQPCRLHNRKAICHYSHLERTLSAFFPSKTSLEISSRSALMVSAQITGRGDFPLVQRPHFLASRHATNRRRLSGFLNRKKVPRTKDRYTNNAPIRGGGAEFCNCTAAIFELRNANAAPRGERIDFPKM